MSKRSDPPETSVLHGIYETLRMHSERKAGKVIGQNLRSGARLAISAKADSVTVIVSRPDKPLGTAELTTFRMHCKIPIGAERAPAEGQQVIEEDGTTWHRVAWRWPK